MNLWVEKYRPEVLEQYVGNESIKNKVEADNNGTGFNIKSSTFVDMVKEGIIDPTKVTRTALENAVSVAGTMLITECTIVDKPSDKETAADPMAMMGM